ncbi:Ankyrin repeat [Rhizoctonia solani]|uniref:Ankyrin repeat n=1 Tax=Rhizoctonia solani TaxID=456999 RepID=A0A8H7LMD6_9AGAM|nr:Ankyrin repeat [Rhizoctonia solani]
MPAITSSRTVQKAEAKHNVTTECAFFAFPSLHTPPPPPPPPRPPNPNYGLHSAAATGNLGLVSFALTNGQPTNAVLDGVLPIHAAASGGNTRVVRMLIDAGADLNIGRLSRKLGASGGKGRAGASGSAMNIYTAVGGSHIGTGGSTALHFAAANGHIDVLTLLLRCGADLSKVDKHGVTPLMLAERLGRTEAAATLRTWAKENPKPNSNSTPNGTNHSLHAKRSLETLLRGPWAGSRVDLGRFGQDASKVDLSISGESRGELGSGSSGVDLGSGSSRTELGELGFYPPLGGSSLNDSRRPSLPTSAGLLFGPKPSRPRSNRTSWSGGKMRRFISRIKRDGATSWDAGERTPQIDWADEVEFRRGERVAVEMGLKAPSAALLMKRASSQNEAVRPRRKASEFHPEPEYDFLEDEPMESRPVIQDDDDMDDDLDMDTVPTKRVLHPRSYSSSSAGFSHVGRNRLTSPSMPILPLPNESSLMLSAATSTTSIPPATSPRRSRAPSPGQSHMRSLSGGMTSRRGLRGSSSFSSFLPRQPEEVMPSSGDSTVDGTAPVANDPSFQPQGHSEPQPPTDAKGTTSMLESPDGRFRGDSLSSTDSENTNQLSSSMATTDTGITTPSLYAATSPLPPHKGAMTFSPVFETEDLDEIDERSENLGETRRHSVTPVNLRSISTFEQAQDLVRQVEREILEPGSLGPDSPSLAEQLAAYGESLAIERRFARGEAQKRAWLAERRSHDEDADEDEDEEGGWASYVREPIPKIGAPLGRASSVDHRSGKYRSMPPPSRTHSMPARQIPMTPLSSALMAPFSPTSQSRTPERVSFTGALPGSQSRQNSGVLARAAMMPRRTASSHGSYVSRSGSIEIIETAPTPIESPHRALELHRRSASTGVSGFPWTSYTPYSMAIVNQSPEHSDDADSHYELNSRTAPLSRITTAPSKIGNAIGNAFSRDPDYEPVRRKKLKRFVKQLVNPERSGTEKEITLI